MALAGCGGENADGTVNGNVDWALTHVSRDGRTLTLAHEGNLCPGLLGRIVVHESARDVTITIERVRGPSNGDLACTAVSSREEQRVRLAAPLGGRTLRHGQRPGLVHVPVWGGLRDVQRSTSP